MLRAKLLAPAILRPAPLRKRLWQGGVAIAILIVTVAVLNAFIPIEKSVTPDMMGHDFLPFYTAGTLARSGMHDLLYDLCTVRALEHETAARNNLELGDRFGPFWNPPFYAWTFATLSRLNYREALLVWTLANVAALLLAILLLMRMLPQGLDWRSTASVPLLVLVSMPFVQAITHAQNSFTSLLLVTLTAAAWRQRKPLVAGVACGLLLYKPQLAAVMALVMALDLGWRVLAGLAGVAGTLLGATALSMPGAAWDYFVKLPANLRLFQVDSTYFWERHATLRAFFRLLIQGRGPGEVMPLVTWLTLGCCALIACGLLVAWWRGRVAAARVADDPWTGDTAAVRRDRLIAATIAATPLLMPFYFDYDLLLLAVPATLLAAEVAGRPVGAALSGGERALVGAWTVTFLWLMVNPALAGRMGVNVTVILLASLCALLIARAARRAEIIESVETQALVETPLQRIAA